jgi:hypothetical protein
MKRIALALSFVVLIASAAFADFRAGIAVRTVTPDPLLPVSGGIGPSKPTSTKHGELTVRAMVFADGESKVAFVSVDFLGFPAVLGNKARTKVKGIVPENILIGATHTHSAPDCYGFPNGTGGTDADPRYLESVCERVADAINEAAAKVQPASLKIATGEAKGRIAFNAYADRLYDPRCSVIQVIDAGGKPFATLVNYAVHPEVLGSSRGVCSPDLIGPLYDRIAEKGAGTGIFMNGAQGGMVTADNRGPNGKDIHTWDECVRIGNLLADEALRIIDLAPLQKSPKLLCESRTISFPLDSPTLRAVMAASPLQLGNKDAKQVTTRLNLVNLGNAQILTIPGEALPNIGFFLKRNMRGEHNLLFGLTNDAFGYILTRVDWNSFKAYAYVSRTCLGEKTGEILIEEALRFVAEMPPPEKGLP